MHMMAYNQGKPHVHGPPTLVNRYSRYRAAIPRQRQVAAIERNPRIARSARCDNGAIQESKDSQGYKTEKRPSTLVIELVNNINLAFAKYQQSRSIRAEVIPSSLDRDTTYSQIDTK